MELFKLYGTIGINNSEATKKIKETTTQAQKAAQNISKGFNSVGDVFSGIGKTFSKIGTTLSATITAPVVGLGIATANTAINFLSLKESASTAFKVLLGSGEAAQKMLDDLYTFSKTTPFSYDTYLTAGKTLVAMGVAAEDCIPYLDGITNAAIATGTGQEGVNSLSQALGRMQSSGKVTLETLNVLTYSGIPAIKILANEYGVTTEEMYKMISNSEILADEALPKLIQGMNEGTDGAAGATAAYGGLAKEMKGNLSGALDSLRSKFRNMSIEIWDAEEAYPELIKVIQDFTSSLDVLPKIFESVSKAAVPVLKTLSDKLKELKEYLDGLSPEQLQQIGNIILGLAAAGPTLLIVGKAFGTIGGALKSIGSIISTGTAAFNGISGAITAAATACGGLAPFLGIIAAAIAVVIGVVIVLKENWDKVVKTFQNFIDNTGLAEKFNQIKESAGKLWEKIKGLKDLFIIIGTAVISSLQPAISVLAGLFNGVVSAIDPLMTAIGGLIDILAGLGKFIVSVFKGDWSTAWKSVKKIGKGIVDVFAGLWDSIVGFLKGFKDGLVGWFKGLFDALKIKETLENVWKNIKNWFSTTAKELPNKLDEWWKIIKKWFKELPQKTKEKLDEWKKSIEKWFEEKVTTFTDGFNKWWENTKIWFSNTQFGETFETIKTEVGKVMEDPNYLITLIEGWTDGLDTWCQEKITEITGKFEEWKTAISNWFTEKWDTITKGFSTWWENTKTWFTTTAAELPTKFDEWKNSIFNWFEEKKNALVDGFTTWFENVKKWLSGDGENSPKDTGETIAENVEQGMENKMKEEGFILRLGKAILKFLGMALLAVVLAIISVGVAIVDYIWKGIQKGWEWLKQNFPILIKKLCDWVVQKWEELKTWTAQKWEEIKEKIRGKFEEAKNKVLGIAGNIKTKISDKWEEIKKNAGEKWDEIKKKITSPVEKAWKTVKEWVDKIKGLFNFEWSLPKLKVPKITTSGKFSLNPPSVPTFSFSWHKKAMKDAYIFDEPTIFGMSGNTLLGGGEAGSETIVGTDLLMDMMREVNNSSQQYTTELLEKILMYLQSAMPELSNRQLVLDTGVLAGALTPEINKNLGTITASIARGRST